jgi:hypothetical protein
MKTGVMVSLGIAVVAVVVSDNHLDSVSILSAEGVYTIPTLPNVLFSAWCCKIICTWREKTSAPHS